MLTAGQLTAAKVLLPSILVTLDQVPPLVPSVNVMVEPAQNAVEVEIVPGTELTVTTVVA